MSEWRPWRLLQPAHVSLVQLDGWFRCRKLAAAACIYNAAAIPASRTRGLRLMADACLRLLSYDLRVVSSPHVCGHSLCLTPAGCSMEWLCIVYEWLHFVCFD